MICLTNVVTVEAVFDPYGSAPCRQNRRFAQPASARAQARTTVSPPRPESRIAMGEFTEIMHIPCLHAPVEKPSLAVSCIPRRTPLTRDATSDNHRLSTVSLTFFSVGSSMNLHPHPQEILPWHWKESAFIGG